MGQQQLLLIILGVIIVGIAVAVGINMFTASASSANRDAVTSDLANLASMAQQHYRRPGAMGGGNNSFDGTRGGTRWIIPVQLQTTANGVYSVTITGGFIGPDSVVIVGVGTEPGNLTTFANDTSSRGATTGLVQVKTTVTPIRMSTAVDN